MKGRSMECVKDWLSVLRHVARSQELFSRSSAERVHGCHPFDHDSLARAGGISMWSTQNTLHLLDTKTVDKILSLFLSFSWLGLFLALYFLLSADCICFPGCIQFSLSLSIFPPVRRRNRQRCTPASSFFLISLSEVCTRLPLSNSLQFNLV